MVGPQDTKLKCSERLAYILKALKVRERNGFWRTQMLTIISKEHKTIVSEILGGPGQRLDRFVTAPVTCVKVRICLIKGSRSVMQITVN